MNQAHFLVTPIDDVWEVEVWDDYGSDTVTLTERPSDDDKEFLFEVWNAAKDDNNEVALSIFDYMDEHQISVTIRGTPYDYKEL